VTSRIVEGFSLTHAQILDGSTAAEDVVTDTGYGDFYGVRTGTIAADTGSYDNTGDDFVLSSWYWINFATVTIQAGYISFDTIALLAGTPIISSGSDPFDYYSLPLWQDNSVNQAPKPMLIRLPAKDKDGNPRTLDFVLYRVQFGPFTFDGPSYKNGLLTNYTGRAVLTDVDEVGNALPRRAIGRLINRPAV
jgi:hypothetical protein